MKKLLALLALSTAFALGFATAERPADALEGQWCAGNSGCGHCEVCAIPMGKADGKCVHVSGCN